MNRLRSRQGGAGAEGPGPDALGLWPIPPAPPRPRPWSRPSRLVPLGALLVAAVLYLAGLLALPPEGLTQHDTGAKYLQVRNLRLTPTGLDWSINYPARALDPQLEWVPFNPKQHSVDDRGRIYLQWPIFLALLTRLPWKVLGFWGLYVVPLLAGLGTLWVTYMLALAIGVPRKIAWLAIPMLGLATPVAIYSLLFFEHTLAALLVALSLLAGVLALQRPETAGRLAVVSGAALAAGIYFRSELYVLAAVMGGVNLVMAWRQPGWRRSCAVWLATLVFLLVPLWAFYGFTDGGILPVHATWYFRGTAAGGEATGLPPLRYIATAGWRFVPDFLFGPQNAPLSPILPLWTELSGLAGLLLCGLAALGRLLRPASRVTSLRLAGLAVGLLLILAPAGWALLSDRPYYNLHGLLLAAPFVALALWPPAVRGLPGQIGPVGWLYAVVLVHVGLHALVISALSGLGPVSLHEWGQRYLLPAYPGLVALSLLAAWRLWSAWGQDRRWRVPALGALAVSGVLALAGMGFVGRGYAVLYDERTQVAGWAHLAATLPDREPLVTDSWWLPLNIAAGFYTRPMMLVEGDDKMAQWTREMKSRGVARFGLMTPDSALLNGHWTTVAGAPRADGPPRPVRGMWLQEYKW